MSREVKGDKLESGKVQDAPTLESDASVMYAAAFGTPDKGPVVRVIPLHVARRLERERNHFHGRVSVLLTELDSARLSLKHAMEAECADCATFKQERDEARAEAARLRDAFTAQNDGDILERMTAAMREADAAYQDSGGGTRHYLRECLFPILQKHGIALAAVKEEAK
jgi:hypothetical protein